MNTAENSTGYDTQTRLWIAFVIALPLSAVIAGLTTVYIAVKNADSVVHEKIVKDGKTLTLASGESPAGAPASARAEFSLLDDNTSVSIQLPGDTTDLDLSLFLVHPTMKNYDRQVPLVAAGDSLYTASLGNISSLPPTNWHLILKSEQFSLRGRARLPQTGTTSFTTILTSARYADY